jgi:endonuclease/exonuclease/phosphatase (EEP) superfamily protein YafD
VRGVLVSVVAWLLAVPSATFAAIRLFGLERSFPMRLLMSFTPYFAVGSLIPLIVAVGTGRRPAALVAGIAAATLIGVTAPRAVRRPHRRRGVRLTVMSVNLNHGRAHPERIIELVRSLRIDLLVLVESTPAIEDRLAGLLPHRITPMPGAAIYSHHPVDGGGTVHVPGARPLLVTPVHTQSPNNPMVAGAWIRDLAGVPAATPDGPVRLLAGDFNATLDHALLRAVLRTGYLDVASRCGRGLAGTWPYDDRPLPPVAIDHLLADRRIGISGFGAHAVSGSDHRAISATLTIPADSDSS